MKGRESGMPEEALWARFFDPPLILGKLGLGSGIHDVAEFGCGYGTFTVPVARMVSGTVYAIDIEPEMLALTEAKAVAGGLRNVRLCLRDFVAEGSGLPSETVDFALLFNILHIEQPLDLLHEAARILVPGGRVGIVHWNYDPSTPRGPSMDIRPSPEQCIAWAETAGFEVAIRQPLDLPPYHYGLVGVKARS